MQCLWVPIAEGWRIEAGGDSLGYGCQGTATMNQGGSDPGFSYPDHQQQRQEYKIVTAIFIIFLQDEAIFR